MFQVLFPYCYYLRVVCLCFGFKLTGTTTPFSVELKIFLNHIKMKIISKFTTEVCFLS